MICLSECCNSLLALTNPMHFQMPSYCPDQEEGTPIPCQPLVTTDSWYNECSQRNWILRMVTLSLGCYDWLAQGGSGLFQNRKNGRVFESTGLLALGFATLRKPNHKSQGTNTKHSVILIHSLSTAIAMNVIGLTLWSGVGLSNNLQS